DNDRADNDCARREDGSDNPCAPDGHRIGKAFGYDPDHRAADEYQRTCTHLILCGPMRSGEFRFLLGVLLVLTIPSMAFAQDAKTLKADGDQAIDRLDFQQALDKYNQAYDKSHDPAILYNRARALQSLNRMPEALDELERFDREAPGDLKTKVP